jgi:hypothetical protein
LAYFLALSIDWNELGFLVGLLAILSLVFSFKAAKRLYQFTGVMFIVLGGAFYQLLS